MLIRCITLLLLLLPGITLAYVPLGVNPESARVVFPIENLGTPQAFFGDLNNFPHTYSLQVDEPFILNVNVFVPDIDRAENIVSGIIVREKIQGGVEEIARLNAKTADWELFNESYGNDTYRVGASFEGEISPGSYIVEVSTPDNRSPYVLSIGPLSGSGDLGYFETIKRIIAIKQFFGKSAINIVESPFVYWPLVSIFIAIGVHIYRVYRRREVIVSEE